MRALPRACLDQVAAAVRVLAAVEPVHPTHPGAGAPTPSGAAPPAAVIEAMENSGFHVTHVYGLTETYGPSALCVWQPDWAALDTEALAARMARQGVANFAIDDFTVLDVADGTPVPFDGETLGEICIRGNTVMNT